MQKGSLAVLALVCGGSASAHVAAAPSCAPSVEVSHAKVVRVERNGVLVLEDGRAVHLEGLLLPGGGQDRAPDFLAQQAISELSSLVDGQTVALTAEPPKEDRYGRIRAEVIVPAERDESWLQLSILRRGLARVSIAPDRRQCASELYAAETMARARRAGIWSSGAYGVRDPAQLARDIGTFQIVQGKVVSVERSGGRIFLDFGQDWRNDFAVTISAEDLKSFRETGVDPFSYAGRTVRVRGWVERFHRPEIEIAAPEDVEMIDAPELRGAESPM
jgi:micrococcal nuclease